jgi:shikimate kinase
VKPLFVIGFMGAGKSTVGAIVAERLGRPFIDLDTEIEREQGMSIATMFSTLGESGFREAERVALEHAAGVPGAVVACGGGVVTDEGSHAILRERGIVVYLQVLSEEAVARVGSELSGRPLLRAGDPSAVAALLKSRERLYEAAADILIDTADRAPGEIADEVVALVEGAL